MLSVFRKHFGYPVQAATLAFINSFLQLIQAFGLHLSQQQDAAVTGVINAAWVLLMALVSYQKNGSVLDVSEHSSN